MQTRAVRKRTKKKVARGTVNATTHTRVSGEAEELSSETSKEFSVPIEDGCEVGYIGVTAGMTKNLGDYNSAKMSVTLHLPFSDKGNDECVEEAYERTTKLVDGFLDAEYKKAIGEGEE